MSNLVTEHLEIIPRDIRSKISMRYKTITKAINQAFWNSSSDTAHSFYVGSYGRGTAVSTSDIDILVEVPKTEYERYDIVCGNGQSRFLQAVKTAVKGAYPTSDIRADGQVVKIAFSDGISFEVLPAFKNVDYYGRESFVYPDTNMGGNWQSTNPKAEQVAMKQKNIDSNGLLQATCRHFRIIRDTYFTSYTLSGIVIDSFVYIAIGNWKFLNQGDGQGAQRGSYEQILKNYVDSYTYFITNSLTAPGSGDLVETASSIECLGKVINKIID